MPRNRIIYQNEGVFVGPSFETGKSYSTPISTNLDRVQSVGYDFSYDRQSISVLGKGGSVDRPIISSPSVTIKVDYLLSSLHNESALGFYIIPEGANSNVSPIKNFADESNRSNDRKNFYLVSMPEGKDLISGKASLIESVLSFHDCQFQSYNANFAVGELPSVSVSFQGIDANYFKSGVNLSIPILDKKTSLLSSGVNVTGIPVAKNIASQTLIPGNVSLSISEAGSEKFINVTNNKIQHFDLSFSANRRQIDLVGYRIAYDKILNYPIAGEASVSLIEDGGQTGSFANFIKQDEEYDISLGIKNKAGQTIINYIFLKAKMETISSNSSIGSHKTTEFNFSYELDPDSSSRGLFISGKAQ